MRRCTLRIYFVAGLSFLLVASTFYFIGFTPLLERLRIEHNNEIDHTIDTGLWLLQGVLGKHSDLAAQSASRTAIRKKQIAYLKGEVSLQQLVEFSAPKLSDALIANKEITGISRYAPNGQLLFGVGQAVPVELAEKCWNEDLYAISLLSPVQVKGKQHLLYCSPIDDRDYGRVGVDILLIDDAEVWRIIEDITGTEAVTICISDANKQVLYWPRSLSASPAHGVLKTYLESEKIDPAYIIESRELKLGNWRLHLLVDQAHFYANIDNQFRMLMLTGLLVSVVIFILTVLVLRPVIRAMLSVEQLKERLQHDGLTGLYNHQYMQELLDRELARIQRNGQNMSLMMLDIDHFKSFNDDYGHQAGDQVLRELSRVIAGLIRTTDQFARYGGEEFMLILPETDKSHALQLAERIRAEVAEMVVETSRGPLQLTISIGMVSFVGGKTSYEKHQIIEEADRALYQSKNEGRNRVTSVELANE
ncbi:GGDEF domain-containing protein [Pseudomonadota bacterium]